MMGTAIDGAKAVAKLAQEYGKMDLYQQAVDLMSQVTEQQQQIMSLTDENARLKEEARIRNQVVFQRNAYWMPVPRENQSDVSDMVGPFCSRCFDVNGKLVRMHDTHQTAPKVGNVFRCPECGKAMAAIKVRMSDLQEQRRHE